MSLPRRARCFVTGGASGLGRALCLALADKGARLWIGDIDLEGAEETCRLALDRGAAEAHTLACDVSLKSDLERVAARIEDAAGGLDLLVNNAGFAVVGDFLSIPMEDWSRITGVNLNGVLHGCQAFLPMMVRQGSGRVLNIASAAGFMNPPKMSPYNVTKAAVISLSESLRSEYQERGISFTVACPTFFPTAIVKNARMPSDEMSGVGQALLDASGCTADDVAAQLLKAVSARQLYALPMVEASVLWSLKRLFPLGTTSLMNRLFRRIERDKRVPGFLNRGAK